MARFRSALVEGNEIAMVSYCYADVVERLFREFEGSIPLPTIVEVTHACRDQLSGSPITAMPELLERLVRQRLHDRTPLVAQPTRSLPPRR
jgi:hypothetical protein